MNYAYININCARIVIKHGKKPNILQQNIKNVIKISIAMQKRQY